VFARLDIYGPMFRDARGIVFNSPPEAALAQSQFELPDRWQVAPEGVEVPDSYDPERFRRQYGIEGDFLVYGGRREWGKNVDWLAQLFAGYVEKTGRDLKLVLFGKGDVAIPSEVASRVIDLGFVSDQDKHDAFAAATVACQPSRWESFSRLLMHAWLAGTPTLSFGGCAVTAYHTTTSGGGLVFEDAVDFEVGLDLLLDRPDLRTQMAARGRTYVLDNFRWDHVIDELVGCISAWAVQDVGVAS
jgi:glycosyltransferase involved in cell wall biosynthesis